MPRHFYTIFEGKCSNLRPLLFPKDSKYLNILDIGHQEVWAKGPLNGVNKWEEKKSVKNLFCRSSFTPFLSKKVQIWQHFFPFLFAKDSEYLKSLDIGLQEVEAKIPLSRVNEQTNTQYKNKEEMAKSVVKKTKSAPLEKSKAYPSWQKLHDDDNFFLSAWISFWI